jgi:hypothetical protein
MLHKFRSNRYACHTLEFVPLEPQFEAASTPFADNLLRTKLWIDPDPEDAQFPHLARIAAAEGLTIDEFLTHAEPAPIPYDAPESSPKDAPEKAKRTFYVSADGAVSKVRPDDCVRTVRAATLAEARELA